MPMIIVRYVTPNPLPGLEDRIAAAVSGWSADHLGKDPGVTAVLVEPAAGRNWWIAGRRPVDDGLSAFWIDVKVTAGTNVKAETTRFVEAAFSGMSALLGPTHAESYVLVHGVDGHAYGYGGRTQEGRWAAANPG
ncbi:4-oxalocrotonate tautomerase [Niveispirillum sp. KHB5.9]|uniref:4-oxalocrotonate tautomerase n=1 Tax=Niveispirillum sp. KHB5.9 TaxID=3400269 RepID=UPI003A867A1C